MKNHFMSTPPEKQNQIQDRVPGPPRCFLGKQSTNEKKK